MTNKQKIVFELSKFKTISYKRYRKLLSKYPNKGIKIFSKSELLESYKSLLKKKKVKQNRELEKFLKTKPTRTISGVAPITVLTKPYKCPGKCIFCPTRSDQPKSYLSSEPGAARAKMLNFDPYDQTKIRIRALENIGHNTEKVELIILGGTWSSYPRKYQLYFIIKCFEAMNGDLSKISEKNNIESLKNKLIEVQKKNESSKHRCVGLVIETRPDLVKEEEVKFLRLLGVTKVQLGVQSLDNEILEKNERGHSVNQIKKAIKLLRLAGFKLHIHWMANLYGSSLEKDFKDFKKLFEDKAICPDELKIYPCLLLKDTKLYDLYKEGKYIPYTLKDMVNLLIKCKKIIPKYCRVTRLFRDIPSFEIVDGVKNTNLRQIVKEEMKRRKVVCNCIRCREIKDREINIRRIKYEEIKYETNVTHEYFLNYISSRGKIIGFLRLSLPKKEYSQSHFIQELKNAAIIREVHVYGVSKKISEKTRSKSPQHLGLGKLLIKRAENIAKKQGFYKLSVISAIGTRNYYRKRGFKLGNHYMIKGI